MTNTRITDPEILEIRYPVMLREYNIRANSGGRGKFNGGNGVVREIQFLKDDIEVGILSERRAFEPFGLLGGENAMRGKNIISRWKEIELWREEHSDFAKEQHDYSEYSRWRWIWKVRT
jgi:5-oxoprolinase (ATP-hydrolysing)